MKKLFLLFIFLSTFAFSAIDECKTDVYFGNGILTTPPQARYNAYVVLQSAVMSLYGSEAEYKKHIGKVSYAYNRTIGQIGDLFESAYQIIDLQELVDIGANWILDDKKTIHSLDLEDQVDKYEASITNGHKVLVVAHSQGNLFAQEAYERLGTRGKDNWMQQYFEAVSIASLDHISDIKTDMVAI